mgnify:CR=1 FL=1
MSSRGRPTTRAKGLKNGFYIELKVKGSNKGTRIMRETHEQAMLALTQFQNKIVRSGKIAWKFKNGEGDCGQRRNGDDCKQFRERSEVSMSPPKSKETWFKFSIFIPKESEFTVPVSNTIWQVHSQKGPPKFMFVISPNGDLQWQQYKN